MEISLKRQKSNEDYQKIVKTILNIELRIYEYMNNPHKMSPVQRYFNKNWITTKVRVQLEYATITNQKITRADISKRTLASRRTVDRIILDCLKNKWVVEKQIDKKSKSLACSDIMLEPLYNWCDFILDVYQKNGFIYSRLRAQHQHPFLV